MNSLKWALFASFAVAVVCFVLQRILQASKAREDAERKAMLRHARFQEVIDRMSD